MTCGKLALDDSCSSGCSDGQDFRFFLQCHCASLDILWHGINTKLSHHYCYVSILWLTWLRFGLYSTTLLCKHSKILDLQGLTKAVGTFYRLTPSLLSPQSITPWTAWCQRRSSASSWRPLDITPCLSLRMSAGSAFSKERPSANQWHRRASAVSWESSWSLRCLQGSSKTGSSERHELKVDCWSLSVSWVYERSFFLKTFHEKAVCFSLWISTPAFLVLSVQKKALHLHWPLVAESFSSACFLTESQQLPEVLMFHILVLFPSFFFFFEEKSLLLCWQVCLSSG